MMRVLIVIPAYNEAQNLERVVDSLIACCPQFDYVIVNDGSADGTKELCEKKHYHVINLPVNLGLTGAVRTGMKYAYQKKYDMAIQFDADGQHLPQYIASMVQHMKESRSDILIASRYVGGKMPPRMRTIGAILISSAIRVTTGVRITDPTSGMRLYSRRIISRFVTDASLSPEPDTLAYLIRNGAKVSEMKVHMEDRAAGQSYLTPVNASRYMIHELMGILVFQWFRGNRKVAE